MLRAQNRTINILAAGMLRAQHVRFATTYTAQRTGQKQINYVDVLCASGRMFCVDMRRVGGRMRRI